MIMILFLGFVTLRGKGLRVTKGDPDDPPTSVQKSYFMLSRSACAVLDIALPLLLRFHRLIGT